MPTSWWVKLIGYMSTHETILRIINPYVDMRSHIRETYIIILRKMSHISAYETILKNNNHMWTYKTVLYLQAICHHINSYCAYDLYVDIWSYIAQFDPYVIISIDNAHYKLTCWHIKPFRCIKPYCALSNNMSAY